MQLVYKSEQNKLERDPSALNDVFERISELIEQEDIVFSHLIVDGVDVYEDHESYINERINEIMQIEIITRTTNEMIWETMLSVQEYLERAVPALKELADEGYDNFSTDTWDGIGQLTEGMQWMLQFVEFTKAAPNQPENWEEFEKRFNESLAHFTELLEAIEAKDTVLIADLLTYEITPAYEILAENIAQLLQDKEFVSHVN